jgi:hypothetical protein
MTNGSSVLGYGDDGDRARVDPRDTTVNREVVQIRENRD